MPDSRETLTHLERVREIFEQVVEEPSQQWSTLVARAANGDDTLAAEVLRLLQAMQADRFHFDEPHLSLDDPARVPEANAQIGRIIARYRLVRLIGYGGMGAVYEGVRADDEYQQRVAIKLIRPHIVAPGMASRFRRERQILAALEHRNIARLLDGGSTGQGEPFFVMEYIEGQSITAYCDEHRLTVRQRLQLFLQACAAVQHAHGKLVVHRDIKPANILVTGDGSVKLLDFGVAKLLGAESVDGADEVDTLTQLGRPLTPEYASPEQLRDEPASAATDVYSVGVVLYELLTRKRPFDVPARTPAAALRAREAAAPLPSAVATAEAAGHACERDATRLSRRLSGELDNIVCKALHADALRRYVSVEQFADDIRRYLDGLPVLAQPDSLAYRIRTLVRRRRVAVASLTVGALALIVGSCVALWQAHDSRIEAARSERIAQFMTRMLGAPSGHTGSSFMRLGTRGTIAAVLDSSILRVPTEFADDPRVRTRLYTAIGSSYIAEGRPGDAARVLDSARALARESYGPNSDAFAEATIDAANAEIHRSPPEVAAALARDAIAALAGRERSSSALYARALVALASAEFVAAHFESATRFAQQSIRTDLARTSAPTMTRGWALRLLAAIADLRDGDYHASDSLSALAVACLDSMGDEYSLERMDALLQRSGSVRLLGHTALADSLIMFDLGLARAGYGNQSREVAIVMANVSMAYRQRGDTARARELADSALAIIQSIPEANALARYAVTFSALVQRRAEHNSVAVEKIATDLERQIAPLHTPLATAFTISWEAAARSDEGDLRDSDALYRRALASYPRTGRDEYVTSALRSQFALVLAREGENREADSLIALLPASSAAAVRSAIAALKATGRPLARSADAGKLRTLHGAPKS